jgi:hypothetical protein
VQSDELQINGRKEDDSGFETIMVFQRPGAGGNIGFLTGSQFGVGQGVIAIGNATVAPTVNPGGGVLYVENGALKYRGSGGGRRHRRPAKKLALTAGTSAVSSASSATCCALRLW